MKTNKKHQDPTNRRKSRHATPPVTVQEAVQRMRESISLGIGDKIVSLHALGKELRKESQEQHKSLMDGLAAIEVAIKQLMPAQAEGSSLPVLKIYESTSQMLDRSMARDSQVHLWVHRHKLPQLCQQCHHHKK